MWKVLSDSQIKSTHLSQFFLVNQKHTVQPVKLTNDSYEPVWNTAWRNLQHLRVYSFHI